MYTCQNCNTTTPANVKAHRVIVDTRTKTYPIQHHVIKRDGKVRRKWGRIGTGCEPVQEITVCPGCARKLTRRPDS